MVALGNDNNGSSLKSKIIKPPRFFKIILEQTIRDGELRIPPAFARKYGDALPKWVTFTVPSGEIWVVRAEKSGGDLFFGKGWQKFSDHFCLKFGHFLVFRYDGNGAFYVLVFDRSATEIGYPAVENVDSDQKADSDSIAHSSSLPEESDGMSMDTEETEDFPVEASGLSFEALIMPGNLKHGYLTVPFSFIQKCAMLEKGQSVTLVCGGKSWSVSFIKRNGSGILSAGWLGFCKGNRLRAGDVYIFELINTSVVEDITFKVSISRAGTGTGTSGLSFMRTVNLKDKYLVVPISFVRKCSMLENSRYVTLVRDGQSWPVKFIRKNSRCFLSAGWSAFRNGNCLREDVCVFELINTTVVGDIVLKVSISGSGA